MLCTGCKSAKTCVKRFYQAYLEELSIVFIAFQPNGVCLIRFKTNDDKHVALHSGPLFFDNKPFVVKEWTPGMKLTKDKPDSIPVWIRLYDLDLKYWGLALPKIVSLVGKPICSDQATKNREFLIFARYLVEVKVGEHLPDSIEFIDENGVCQQQLVHFEWKPILCTVCKGVGHETVLCKKKTAEPKPKKTQQVWKPKAQAPLKENIPQQVATKQTDKGSKTDVALPLLQPNMVVTPMPYQGSVLNSLTPARFINRFSKKGEGCSAGPSFVDVISYSIRKNLMSSMGKGLTNINTNGWVDVLLKDVQVIHATVEHLLTGFSWVCSLVYGCNKDSERVGLWQSILHCNSLVNGPWLLMGDFNKNIVAQAWGQKIKGTRMFRLVSRLKSLKLKFKDLNRSHFSDIENAAEQAMARLTHIRRLQACPGDPKLLRLEYETTRRHQNVVHEIRDHKGVLHTSKIGIQQAFLEYYHSLLGSQSAVTPVNVHIVRRGKVCDASQRQRLLAPVTKEEIKNIIHQIPNDKAPGPDGYSSKFYKDAWGIIGADVTEAVQDFFRTGQLLKQVNATMVTLIPKVDRPSTVLQFRPIACCNVIYKCISKVLCNRLALILPEVVSQNQGGFIQGRSIMENILICQDIIRLYSRGNVSPRCLFKLDLQKAYDTVEWSFLNQMLSALKFPRTFIGWVMQCVTTATYTLSLNGDSFGFFEGKRGLRQGDPLSPLLFTVCMEYLTRLLAFTTETMSFHYHPLCKPLRLTHLMFADDLLLFCKGDVQSIMVLLRTYSTFSIASGLKMSKGKSNVYFNGVREDIKHDILQVSGCVEGNLPFRYLGVPIKTTRLTAPDCAPIIEKLMTKIRGLGTRKLTYAGRLVLIKAVLKTYHNYWAQMFILPSGVIARIEAICRNFLWDGSTEYMRTPLVGWSKICKPKYEGGLGLKDDLVWNRAALGKLLWWLYAKPDHLWVKWVSHTYLKAQDWKVYVPTQDTSWYWRKICKVKDLLIDPYLQKQWDNIPGKTYTITKGYEYLRNKNEQVTWSSLVWNQMTIPKHSFIAWIYFHKGLNTNEKLKSFGLDIDTTCLVCGDGNESLEHLFFSCKYSQRIINKVEQWMGVTLPRDEVIAWRNNIPGSQVKKDTINGIINALIYSIWSQRNRSKHEAHIINPEKVASEIIKEMKIWIAKVVARRKKVQDHWIFALCGA
ncbi:uncharacterized protein LOC141649128 [Silene latifolia]|uniref:uncharacterized protein LOC141649128 n=1 Tax=Silene latifolia TaxID=37657 RepID=UPI003D77EDF4